MWDPSNLPILDQLKFQNQHKAGSLAKYFLMLTNLFASFNLSCSHLHFYRMNMYRTQRGRGLGTGNAVRILQIHIICSIRITASSTLQRQQRFCKMTLCKHSKWQSCPFKQHIHVFCQTEKNNNRTGWVLVLLKAFDAAWMRFFMIQTCLVKSLY